MTLSRSFWPLFLTYLRPAVRIGWCRHSGGDGDLLWPGDGTSLSLGHHTAGGTLVTLTHTFAFTLSVIFYSLFFSPFWFFLLLFYYSFVLSKFNYFLSFFLQSFYLKHRIGTSITFLIPRPEFSHSDARAHFLSHVSLKWFSSTSSGWPDLRLQIRLTQQLTGRGRA